MSTPNPDNLPPPEEVGYEFLLYGHEHILRGSDTAVLVAFAALAYQGLSGANQPHQIVGFGLLLVSVLMCALVHFAVGNLYTGRAKKLLQGQKELLLRPPSRNLATVVAWIAGIIQLVTVLTGVALILIPELPEIWKPIQGQ